MGEVKVNWEKSLEDFDISKYTPYTFYVSKKELEKYIINVRENLLSSVLLLQS
jgi:nitrogen fixation protein